MGCLLNIFVIPLVNIMAALIAVSHFEIALRTGWELCWIALWHCFGELTNENKQPIKEELASRKHSHNAIPHNSNPVSRAASKWQITLLKKETVKMDLMCLKVDKVLSYTDLVSGLRHDKFTSCLCNFLFLLCVVKKKYLKTKRPTWGSNPRPWD